MKVIAVIPTFNRTAQLGECLGALASQTSPVDAVVVVDNASTEPIRAALEQRRYPFPVGYVRIDSNTGSAGGFAAGVSAALEAGADWVWIQDNDGVARRDCLERLLEAASGAPGAAVLAPQVYDEEGGVQGQHRGRYVRGHTLPASEDTYKEALVPVDYASYIGVLVDADAIAAAGGPDPRLFLWVDDLEWCLRLGEHGPLYLVPRAAITHNDGIRNRSAGFLATVRTHLFPGPNAALWRYLYAFRNSSWLRMRRHGQGPLGWSVNYLLQAIRVLIVGPQRRHAPRLFWWYGMAGRREAWGQIPHAVWEECLGRGGDVRLLHPITSPYLEGREQPTPGPTEWIDSGAASGRS
ncbi:MAG TPA: glycosyltransferase [Solirubrobacterales bacterium]|nr:glycosyltransferase [Solirubrobacterales bacterium]